MHLVVMSNAGTVSANSAPSGATAGEKLWRDSEFENRLVRGTDRALLLLKGIVNTSTAGSLVVKLWGYSSLTAEWHPLGTNATDADKGKLNEANAMGETGTDKILHAELVEGLSAFERIYAELVTATDIDEIYIYLAALAGTGAARH